MNKTNRRARVYPRACDVPTREVNKKKKKREIRSDTSGRIPAWRTRAEREAGSRGRRKKITLWYARACVCKCCERDLREIAVVHGGTETRLVQPLNRPRRDSVTGTGAATRANGVTGRHCRARYHLRRYRVASDGARFESVTRRGFATGAPVGRGNVVLTNVPVCSRPSLSRRTSPTALYS